MKNKIVNIDFSAEMLAKVGGQKLEKDDLIGAVKMYREALEKEPFNYRNNIAIAEICTDTSLYRYAVNYWFRALACATTKEETARACNGLGAVFYYMSEDFLACDYFALQRDLGFAHRFAFADEYDAFTSAFEDLMDEIESFKTENEKSDSLDDENKEVSDFTKKQPSFSDLFGDDSEFFDEESWEDDGFENDELFYHYDQVKLVGGEEIEDDNDKCDKEDAQIEFEHLSKTKQRDEKSFSTQDKLINFPKNALSEEDENFLADRFDQPEILEKNKEKVIPFNTNYIKSEKETPVIKIGLEDFNEFFKTVDADQTEVEKGSEKKVQKALEYLLNGENQKAKEIAEDVLNGGYTVMNAYFVYCSACYKLGEVEKGEWAYQKLLGMELQLEGIVRMFALCLDLKKEVDALRYADLAINLDRYNVNLIYARGLLNYNLGNYEQALSDIKNAYFLTGHEVIELTLSVISKPEGERPKSLPYAVDIDGEILNVYKEKVAKALRKDGLNLEEIIKNIKLFLYCGKLDVLGMLVNFCMSTDKEKTIEAVRLYLLDYDLESFPKIVLLKELLFCDFEGVLDIVIEGKMTKVSLSLYKSDDGLLTDFFREVHAIGTTMLGVINPKFVDIFLETFEEVKKVYIEKNLAENGDVFIMTEPLIIAGVIIYFSNLGVMGNLKSVSQILNVKEESLIIAIKALEFDEN